MSPTAADEAICVPPKKKPDPERNSRAGRLSFVLSILVAGEHRLLRHQMLDINPETFSDPASISRVSLQKVPNLLFLNALGRVPQAPDDIANQAVLRIRLHQTEEIEDPDGLIDSRTRRKLPGHSATSAPTRSRGGAIQPARAKKSATPVLAPNHEKRVLTALVSAEVRRRRSDRGPSP
jgi:hypothetical protein